MFIVNIDGDFHLRLRLTSRVDDNHEYTDESEETYLEPHDDLQIALRTERSSETEAKLTRSILPYNYIIRLNSLNNK
jgi:hypothetical protein